MRSATEQLLLLLREGLACQVDLSCLGSVLGMCAMFFHTGGSREGPEWVGLCLAPGLMHARILGAGPVIHCTRKQVSKYLCCLQGLGEVV